MCLVRSGVRASVAVPWPHVRGCGTHCTPGQLMTPGMPMLAVTIRVSYWNRLVSIRVYTFKRGFGHSGCPGAQILEGDGCDGSESAQQRSTCESFFVFVFLKAPFSPAPRRSAGCGRAWEISQQPCCPAAREGPADGLCPCSQQR